MIAGPLAIGSDPRFDRRMAPTFSDRPATADDHETWARLFRELGVDDPVPTREKWAADFAGRTRMLEADGRVVGYGMSHVVGSIGYVSQIVIDPGERRRGAARAMMLRMAARFRELGCVAWALQVKPDNEPARRLYESLGLVTQYGSKAFRLAWDDAARLPREDGPFTLRAIELDDDAAIEASFRLLPGLLAVHRARARRVQRQLVEARPSGEACVGVVSFDLDFIHASPFRMARPALAPWLIDALRPYAQPGDAGVGLMAEDDPALAEALAAVGGEVRLEALLLRGPLPQG